MDSTSEEDYSYEDYENISLNISYEDYHMVCDKDDVRSFARVFLPVVYGICFVVGLAGNTLVVAVYVRCKRMKTMTDIFIVHLAVADLLLLVTLPCWAVAAVQGWELGEALCKFVSALYTVSFTSSMMLLAGISLDQYLALRSGGRDQGLFSVLQRKHSAMVCLMVWAVAVSLGIPDLASSSVVEVSSGRYCLTVSASDAARHSRVGLEVLEVLLGFLLPLLVMLFCYGRMGLALRTLPLERKERKWRAIRVLMAVVGVFMVTQIPYNVVKFYRAMDVLHFVVTHCRASKGLDRAAQITEALALSHSCLNPVLYAFIGSSFSQRVMRFAKDFGERRRSWMRGMQREEPREEPREEISFTPHAQPEETSTFSI